VAYRIGQAFIDVTPSLRDFNNTVRKELAKELRQVDVPLTPRLDGSQVEKDSAKIGDRAAGQFANSFKRRLDRAIAALPEIDVNVTPTVNETQINALRQRLLALRDVEIGVDIDAGAALIEIEAIRRELDRISSSKSATVDVRANTAAARAQLQLIEEQVNSLDGRQANVTVDVNDRGAVSSARFLSTQFNGLILLGGLIGPALVPGLGAAAVAAGGLASALAGASVGIGGLIAAVVPSISAVTEAVKAQEAADKSAATTATQSGIQRVTAAYAAQQAAERVADAQRNVGRVAEENARRIEQAERRVADAGQAVARAQADQIRAQVDLDRARQDALRTLEDMRERLSDIRRDEQSAEISLIEAQQRLADANGEDGSNAIEAAQISLADARAALSAVNADGTASELDRRRALLAVAEAEQRLEQAQRRATELALERRKAALQVEQAEDRLSDTKRDQQRATEDLNEAERAGIDGMDAVVSAQQALESSTLAVTRAVQSSQDAEAELAQTRQDAAIASADAARAVTDAMRAQAQQAQVAAMQTAAGTAAMQNLAYAMDQLTPMQRELMEGWYDLRDAFIAWSRALEPVTIPVLLAGMQLLKQLLPALTPIVEAVAGAFSGLLDSAGAALESPFWQEFFDFLASSAGPNATAFGQALGNIATGFAGLLMAFGPVSGDIMNGLVDLTEAFANWGKSLDTNQGFQNFLDYVQENWPKVRAMLGAFVGAIENIIRAMAPLGGPVLTVLTAIFDVIGNMDPSLLAAITAGILGIAAATKIWSIAQAAINIGLKGNVLVIVITLLAGLITWLVRTWQTSERFRNVVFGVLDAVKNAFWTSLNFIKDIGSSVFNWFKNNWPLLLAILTGPIGLAVLAIVKNWDTIRQKASDVKDAIAGFFSNLGEVIASAFDAGLDALKTGINWLIGLVNKWLIGGLNVIVDVIPGIPNIEDIPLIPMHSGGIVPGTGETPRMLLGGEAVLNPDATQRLGEDTINRLNSGEGIGGPFDGWSWDTIKTGLGLGLSHGQNADLINDASELLQKGASWLVSKTLDPALEKLLNVIPEKPFLPNGMGRETVQWVYDSLLGWAKDKDETRPTIVDLGLSGVGKEGFVFPLLPLTYRVGEPPGPPWGSGYTGHTGQDFPTGVGSPVLSSMAGVVNFTNLGNRSYGKYASVQGANGVRSISAHLSAFAGKTGRVVLPGELIGLSGSTGNSSGPHLHQEYRVNGSVVDPRRFLTYDSGGYLMPGLTLAYNGGVRPERVLDPAETRAWESGVAGGTVINTYGSPRSLVSEMAFMYETRRQARRPVMRG